MRSGPSWARSRRTATPTNPDDDHCGDYWDHVAFDPEHKLVLAVVPGARTEENAACDRRRGEAAAGRRAAGADDQRRVPGVRDGDRGGLRRAGARPAAAQAGPAARRARAAVAGRA